MKHILPFILISIFLIPGCKDDNPVTPPVTGTTIFTSSFESNGNTSLDGWNILNGDTMNVSFATDAPSGGGTYSIALENVNTLPVMISKTAALPIGQNIFVLTVFSKYTGAGGNFSLGLKNQQVSKIVEITDAGWKQYTVEDTLTAVQGDSIVVTLSGATSQLLPGRTYFDIVSLKVK